MSIFYLMYLYVSFKTKSYFLPGNKKKKKKKHFYQNKSENLMDD